MKNTMLFKKFAYQSALLLTFCCLSQPIFAEINSKNTVSITSDELQNFPANPEPVKKLIFMALDLTTKNLGYSYGSANPDNKGMDCSGTIYYLLTKIGIKDTPRSSDLIYRWVVEKGHFHPVQAKTFSSTEFSAMKPGDLLFWNGTYAIQRQYDVTHVMLYLGKNKNGKPLMMGSSNGRTYQGKKIFGVSVFDFQLPDKNNKSNFLGYGCIPSINCSPVK